METVHNKTYSKLIKELISDEDKKKKLILMFIIQLLKIK